VSGLHLIFLDKIDIITKIRYAITLDAWRHVRERAWLQCSRRNQRVRLNANVRARAWAYVKWCITMMKLCKFVQLLAVLRGKKSYFGFCVITRFRSRVGPFYDFSWVWNWRKMQKSDRRSVYRKLLGMTSNFSDFAGHIAISVCWSTLKSFG